jgi:hypothetical protein
MIALHLKIKLEVEAVGAQRPPKGALKEVQSVRCGGHGKDRRAGIEEGAMADREARPDRQATGPEPAGKNGQENGRSLAIHERSKRPFHEQHRRRALRVLKLKGKISGCIRDDEMAERFSLFIGYRVSCAHQGIVEWEAICMLAEGRKLQFIRDKLTENV